ncbi:MAG: DUF4197 domain-containing protein [Prolixibacteraceae bacterium]|nr:DUF4197 domain-containing protein [Prolixibacteraceae bacterium]
MKKISILIIATILLSSCAELMQVAQQTLNTAKPLTQSEIIAGLKEALIVGTDSSANKLGALNGYYGDQLVKIMLPPEAAPIVDNLSKIPGGDKLVEDVIVRINRAAENAASEAKPIFVYSIKSMTIADAVGILKGSDNAATEYLRKTTYDQLVQLYSPKIRQSLDKKLVAGISTNDSWDKLAGEWNKIARSVVGQVAGFKPVEVKLEEYLTAKALDGLFLKIAEEENQIRKDPLARVTELLKRVFA